MKHLLIGLLAANGVTLANEASDQTVLEKVSGLVNRGGGAETTLANEKVIHLSTIADLEKAKNAATALANEASTTLANAKLEIKAERQGRAELAVDLAIHQGKIAVNERDAQITTLANSADFPAEAKKLADKAAIHKTGAPATDGGMKTLANATGPAVMDLFLMEVGKVMKERGCGYNEAFQAVKASNPTALAK